MRVDMTTSEFLGTLSDRQLESLCRMLGIPEEEIEAHRFKPDTRTPLERMRDTWDDPEEAARLTGAGFHREGMMRMAEGGELVLHSYIGSQLVGTNVTRTPKFTLGARSENK